MEENEELSLLDRELNTLAKGFSKLLIRNLDQMGAYDLWPKATRVSDGKPLPIK